MSDDFTARLDALRSRVHEHARQHYRTEDAAEAERLAAMAGDAIYFQARLRLAEAERDAASLHLLWMSPRQPPAAKESLRRIRALCSYWPDLYEAMQAVLATHPLVARDILARAIKRCRRDTDVYSVEDVTGLLISAWNGGRHGFDAVLRSRKQAERKVVATPWVKSDD